MSVLHEDFILLFIERLLMTCSWQQRSAHQTPPASGHGAFLWENLGAALVLENGGNASDVMSVLHEDFTLLIHRATLGRGCMGSREPLVTQPTSCPPSPLSSASTARRLRDPRPHTTSCASPRMQRLHHENNARSTLDETSLTASWGC